MKMGFARSTLCLGLLALALAAGAASARDEWRRDEWRRGVVARARMAAAGERADGALWAVIELAMPPGWRSYWRWPGEGGIPPVFDWSGSRNLGAVALVWPAPERFESSGSIGYGYRDAMILAAVVRPEDRARPVSLALTLRAGVCGEICVPEEFRLTADLSPSARAPDWAEELRRRALAAAPTDARAAGVTLTSCRLSARGRRAQLELTASVPPALEGARVVLAPPPDAAPEQVNVEWIAPNRLRLRAALLAAPEADHPPDAPSVTLLPASGAGAVEFRPCDG